jgi:uncharacterized protein (DUF433 family)
MIQQLQQAFENVSRMPVLEQNLLANALTTALHNYEISNSQDETQWDELFQSTVSQQWHNFATQKLKHPYITFSKDYCSRSPVIAGTKFPVRSVVNYVLKQGMMPEELVKEFNHLTLAQVYDALSYYYDYSEEIERELLENTETQLKEEWS